MICFQSSSAISPDDDVVGCVWIFSTKESITALAVISANVGLFGCIVESLSIMLPTIVLVKMSSLCSIEHTLAVKSSRGLNTSSCLTRQE